MQKIKQTFAFAGLLVLAVAVAYPSFAQDKSKRPSPPAQASGEIGEASIVIDYSSPAVKGREVWGKLVPYGSVWRMGANEATTIEVSSKINFGSESLDAGKYSLFAIPGENEWTVIVNSVSEQWGAFSYDASKDVLRTAVKPSKSDEFHERMTFYVAQHEIVLNWENLVLKIPVKA